MTTNITIADRAGKSFPMHAHAQGYARWKSGSVSIEEESPRAIAAKVGGSAQTRDVRLQERDGRLLVQCTCPARTFERPGCKHVWATLLEVDRRGALEGLRTARTPLPVSFLEPPSPKEPAPVKAEKKEKKEEKKPKVSRDRAQAADRASPRSPRATAAPPAARGKPRRSPPRPSARRR